MSNYINVLRRLERERRIPEATPAPAAVPNYVETHIQTAPDAAASAPAPSVIPESIAPTPPPAPAPAPRTVIALPNLTQAAPLSPALPVATVPQETSSFTRQLDTRRSRAFATEAHPGIANLLDNIRILSSARASRMVVFCGASNAEAVTNLAEDLATHAAGSGMKAFVGTLTRTTAGTAITAAPGASIDTTPLKVDLDAGTPTAELQSWVERVAPNSDLVVITGPPLATSIDAALLACACDGLVIVAESEVTERAALQIAAERARIAGCRTLGVVMHGTKDRLPGWIRRLMGDRSEPRSARED